MTMGMLFLAFPRIADATKAKYDILKAGLGTGGDAVDCTACHVGWRDAKESRRRQVRRSLNAFGKDYKDWSRLRRGKVEDLLAKDSDGDGVSNGDELRGGSNPSDRQSVPKTASADGCGLDPNCRLAKMIQEEGRSFDSDRQRRAAYAQFLLALLSGDEKTLANVVAAGGYCEGDESKGLCAADLLKRWKELNVAWPKDQSLDALIDCQASKFATPVTFKRLIPGIQRKPEATQYPVYAPLCGQCTILKGPPVVILEKQARRWRVIGGNVLSCWAKPPTATQPAAAPAAAKPAEAPPATPAAPKRTVTVNVRPVGKSK
jgi:hypothetical protein